MRGLSPVGRNPSGGRTEGRARRGNGRTQKCRRCDLHSAWLLRLHWVSWCRKCISNNCSYNNNNNNNNNYNNNNNNNNTSSTTTTSTTSSSSRSWSICDEYWHSLLGQLVLVKLRGTTCRRAYPMDRG